MKKVLICLAIAIALFSYGCSSKPALTAEEEGPYSDCDALLKQADVDVKAAKQAGADTFAKELFSTAAMSLENSKIFLDKKEFDKSKESSMRASEDAKKSIAVKKQAEDGITETEKLINAAKEAKIDEESPEAFKEAVAQLDASKKACVAVDYNSANIANIKAVEAIKKATEEPTAAKNSVAAVENDMNMAKELKIDTVSPDAFKIATESYDLAKSSLAVKDNAKALDNATKASTTLRDEMKKAVNLDVEQAKAEINTAKEAGAAEFAAEQLAIAEESLSNASTSIEKNDFVNAKASAEKVTLTAKEAEAKAKAGKEAKVTADAATAPAAPTTTDVVTDQTAVASAAVPMADTPKAEEKPAENVAANEVKAEETKVDVPKPADEPKKDEVVAIPPKKDGQKGIKVGNKEEIPLITATKARTGNSKFPIIPVAVVVVVAIALVFVIRMIRKKATSVSDSQTA